MLSRLLMVLLIANVAAAQAPPMPPPAAPATPPATPPAATPPASPPGMAAPAYPTDVGGKDLATWLKILKESKDGYQREMAVKAIPNFGPGARSTAIKLLCSRLPAEMEKDPGVRINMILALGIIGADKPEDAKIIVDALNGILNQSGVGSPVRLHATRSLAYYGPAGAIAVPTVVNLANDPAWETRQAAAYTLARIGRPADPKKGPNLSALNLLAKQLLIEESAMVRLEIAQSLLLMGVPLYKAEVQGDYERAIKPYLDAVEKQLAKETDPATKVWLMMTHMTYDARVFNDTTVVKIADYINQPEVPGKLAALRALALLGEKAKPALPSVLGALKWTEPEMVAEAIVSVSAMKTAGKDALPDLERIKAGKDEFLKNLATQAIDIINGKPPAPPAPPMPPKP